MGGLSTNIETSDGRGTSIPYLTISHETKETHQDSGLPISRTTKTMNECIEVIRSPRVLTFKYSKTFNRSSKCMIDTSIKSKNILRGEPRTFG